MTHSSPHGAFLQREGREMFTTDKAAGEFGKCALGKYLTTGIVKPSFRNAFELGLEVPDQMSSFPGSLV